MLHFHFCDIFKIHCETGQNITENVLSSLQVSKLVMLTVENLVIAISKAQCQYALSVKRYI